MAVQIDHDAKSIKDALGIDIEDFDWIKDYLVDYSEGKVNFSQIIDRIIKKIRKDEFGDEEIEISKYETKLIVASYLWGSYYSLFNFLIKGIMENNEAYAPLLKDILRKEEKDE